MASYLSIVRPLTELTKGYAPTQKGKKNLKEKTKTYLKESELFGDWWDQACTDAFHRIIQCLTNAPVLAFADANKPYILHKGLVLCCIKNTQKDLGQPKSECY